ncbi:Planctomycete cytochrome C [Lacipirellula limnantheis]|uniref:Planctomycete cytochrome C n=2 Tax=Lacipirellula limnantheis TaxID=2528024 RepID=A0A517TSZ3_9BACT|nr:Planctomycete cytochrome C [Lacipirellula limnantheis]
MGTMFLLDMHWRRLVSGLLACVGTALAGDLRAVAADAASSAQAPVRFGRDIRPILSHNCFLCHGQDEKRRGAGLRLDEREQALAELESGLHAIVPGKPEESELVARITAEDDSLRMPPPESHKTLTAEQIELVRRWIAEGAEYEPHWSFIPPQQVDPPADAAASVNPIDAFVRARLARDGLSMAPAADRRTLIRRVTLDLTGLPPTLDEIEAFLADERPDAYERVVDRLLASPRYGERMALDWLDAARYADTHGYHIDSQRDMWAWRDWVIKAFNENMPFDQFTVWQLAGDLLPEATTEHMIASGFNRNHPVNFEGGAIPEEYHVEYVVDRATTTATVWLGLTVGCARCHDHKYDPITQKEFFQFFAFFNNVDEEGLDGYRGNAKPMLELPSDAQRSRREKLNREVAEIEQQLKEREAAADQAQAAWEAIWRDRQTSAKVRPGEWFLFGPVSLDTPALARAESFGVSSPVNLETTFANQDGSFRWLPGPQFVDGNEASLSGDAAAAYLTRQIGSSEDTIVRARLGTSDGVQVWLNGELIWDREEQATFSPDQRELELHLREGSNELLIKLVNYAWEWQFEFALDPRLEASAPANVVALLEIAPEQRTEEQAAALRHYFRENHFADDQYRDLTRGLGQKRAELAELKAKIPSTMVMREREELRKTFLLARGQYTNPTEELSPGTPRALPPLPAGEPANRLTLARWLTAPGHPLTARVTVNRLWQALFGTGLVKTAEDFGLQGAAPANADLLDWLAVEFVDSGWDVKQMLRLMVTSDAYRQSSASSPELFARDPDNQLLAHGPRFRMPAEFIRDLALAASGTLDARIGGASVKPYQPGDLWGELAHQKTNYKFTAQLFEQDHGADLYRRSMYTFWKRSVPPVNLVALDAPSRETCTVRRERTNTPLQALVLLNDPTFVEAARHLAERMMAAGQGDPSAAIARGFELVTARRPTEQEAAILAAEYERQLASFAADAGAADALLAIGESPRDQSLDAVSHAAWTNVALVILNLDEAITRN